MLIYSMCHGYMVVLAVFVDDVLIACANSHIITEIKSMFKDHYTVTDMGWQRSFWGCRSPRGTDTPIWINNSTVRGC